MRGGFRVADNTIAFNGLAIFFERGISLGVSPILNACNTPQFERIQKVSASWTKVG